MFSYANFTFTLIMRERPWMLSNLSKPLTLSPTEIPWRHPWFGHVRSSLRRNWVAFSSGWAHKLSFSHPSQELFSRGLLPFSRHDPAPHCISYSVGFKREHIHLTEAHWSCLSIILCRAFLPSNRSALLPSLVHSANWLKVHPIPLDQIFDIDIKQNKPQCQALMRTIYDQLPTGFLSFTTTLLAWPSSQIFMQKTFFFPEFHWKVSIQLHKSFPPAYLSAHGHGLLLHL